jgi:hypothetical protein
MEDDVDDGVSIDEWNLREEALQWDRRPSLTFLLLPSGLHHVPDAMLRIEDVISNLSVPGGPPLCLSSLSGRLCLVISVGSSLTALISAERWLVNSGTRATPGNTPDSHSVRAAICCTGSVPVQGWMKVDEQAG